MFNTIILCPHPVSIGNASEDYYFGLLKARKEGKKLLVLFPFNMPGRFRIKTFDPAILYLNSRYLAVKYRGIISLILCGMFTAYFILIQIIRMIIGKIIRIQYSGYYWRPLAGQDILWRPDASVIEFDWEMLKKIDWHNQFSAHLELSLSRRHFEYCEFERERLKLPHDAWFACLHVREGGYSGDWDNFRNADITTYISSIKEITERGGWVVRMGDPTMKKLPELDRVIDYPFTCSRSSIMDVYLLLECDLFIGTSSGILDTAFLLGKPVVLSNMTSWLNVLPLKKGDLSIFKHIYSIPEKRFLSIKEWLLRASMIKEETWSSPDWELVDNTEEEILSVVREKLNAENISSPTVLQCEFKRVHLHVVKEMSSTFRFDKSDLENCNEWFRHASRMITWEGEIGEAFLKNNWNRHKTDANIHF